MAKKAQDYVDFVNKVGHASFEGVDMTDDGYPLSAKESKFIDMFLVTGDVNKSLREAKLQMRSIAGKDYITDEITYRLDQLKKVTIADADEIMQYFTKVMRGEEKDQFGLDPSLQDRNKAAEMLGKRYRLFTEKVEANVDQVVIFEGEDELED